jgi:uncharacterized DUF497 family protein
MKLRIKDHEFDWDEDKAKLNLRKHGVSFAIAACVFDDPAYQTLHDSLHSDDEDRWTTYGRVLTGRLLSVSHTIQDLPDGRTFVRLISARTANSRERLTYESGGNMIREAEDLPFGGNDPRQVFRGGHRSFDEGVWRMSIFLDKDLLMYFIKLAAKGTEGPTAVINGVLRREIDRLEKEKRESSAAPTP